MITWNDLPIIIIGVYLGKVVYSITCGIIKAIKGFRKERKNE
jgi:hypothetical protein